MRRLRHTLNMNENLNPYLNEDGHITTWPTDEQARRDIRDYLAHKIPTGVAYTEAEIDAILSQWHTFGDPAMLRHEIKRVGWLQPAIGGKLRRIAYFMG